MKWKCVCLLLVLATLFASLAGCGSDQDNNSDPQKRPVNLIYYTIGNPDPELKLVENEINRLLKQKLNVTIQYNKISWGDYGTKLNSVINSGGAFDIAYASSAKQGNYDGNAKNGAWLPLDDYLQKEAKETYELINPMFWEGVKVNGKIYGIPTNKEIAVPQYFFYPKSLVDKYNIDITQYTTLQSLAPLLEMIHEKEPDYTTFELESSAHNYFGLDNYEYILYPEVPLMVNSKDKALQVLNIYETDYCRDILKTLQDYYEKGYINPDAPVREVGHLIPNEKVFLRISSGGPYSDISWSNDRKYTVVSQQVEDAVVTTESTRGGIMVINSMTQHPTESVAFLNCLNTDPEIRNLFNFGIEGTHYTLTDQGQVDKISDLYAGVQYTQGNWFILKTTVGDPLDKWEKYQEFNASAYRSELLGFSADTSSCQDKLLAIQEVSDKYYSCLMTGCVDVDTFLPMFIGELKQAGIDDVKELFQQQIDEWKKSK